MLIDQIESDVKALVAEPFPSSDAEAVDLAGRVNKLANTLANLKRALLSEIPGAVTGSAYQLTESRKASRSYNTPALLRDFEKAGVTVTDLITAGALTYQWRWTELRREAIAADIGLRIAGHELTDAGDEADHVGEHWQTETKLEAREF